MTGGDVFRLVTALVVVLVVLLASFIFVVFLAERFHAC